MSTVEAPSSLLRRHPLAGYAARRIGIAVVLLVVVSILIFVATQVLPGDAADTILGRSATAAQKAILRQQLGLNRSWPAQYWGWISGVLTGNLGHSFGSNESVAAFIGARLGNSLALALGALVVLVPVSVLLGTIAGIRRGRAADHIISGLSLALIALPEFVTGTILALVFGITLAILPPTSIIPSGAGPLSDPRILVLPVLTLCLAGAAYIIRMLRAGVVEAMASDYVQAARLNGIPEGRVIIWHVLRNALAPTVQVVALTVQWLIGGIVVVESVLLPRTRPGLGRVCHRARHSGRSGADSAHRRLVHRAQSDRDMVVILLVPKLRTTL